MKNRAHGRVAMSQAVAAAFLAAFLLGACGGGDGGGGPAEWDAPYADRVIDHSPVNPLGATVGVWPYFFQPMAALGPPDGTLNVVSLGYDSSDPTPGGALGGSLTVGLGTGGSPSAPVCIVDGPGDDFAVFENPFPHTDPGSGIAGTSNEVVVVEASQDGGTWYEYTPSLNTCANPVEPGCYNNLAGVTPTSQGGDRFDLANLTGAPPGFRACFLRLGDGGTLWPDYGNTQTDLWDSGADIDAVRVLHYEPL